MSEAPERIWAWEYKGNSPWGPVKPDLDVVKNGAEYIRADRVDALLKAEREKALREAAAWTKSEGLFRTSREILALIEKDKTDDNN